MSSPSRYEELWESMYEERELRREYRMAREVAEEDGAGGGTDGSSADEEDEAEEHQDEEEEEEQERDGVQLVAGDCGPSPPARVSGVAAAGAGDGDGAAVERGICPVCLDPLTYQGPHRMSCVPCGHVYGRSCLEKWLTQCGNRSATCPQCSKRFKHKDIINLYAQYVAIPNTQPEKVVPHEKMFEEMTKNGVPLWKGNCDPRRQVGLLPSHSKFSSSGLPVMPPPSVASRFAAYWAVDALASDESLDFSVLSALMDSLGTIEGAPETIRERVVLRCLQQLSSVIPIGGDAVAMAGVPRLDGSRSCQDVLFQLTTEVQVGSSGKLDKGLLRTFSSDIQEAICRAKLTLPETFIHQLKDLEKMELDVVEAEGRPLKRVNGT